MYLYQVIWMQYIGQSLNRTKRYVEVFLRHQISHTSHIVWGQIQFGQMTLHLMDLDEMAFSQLKYGQKTIDQLKSGQMTFRLTTLCQQSLGQLTFGLIWICQMTKW